MIGTYCKEFRTRNLQLTLHQLSDITGIKVPTIAAFENGRSTNINHLNTYIKVCNPRQTSEFLDGLSNTLRSINHGG